MKKVFTVAQVRDLLNHVQDESITFSRFVEILNECADGNKSKNYLIKMGFTLKASPTNEINPWRNKAKLGDFWCHNYYVLWQTTNIKKGWRHVFISFGIRRSDMWQLFPIWLTGNNCQKSVLFGFWKLYFEVGYRY